MLILSTPMPVIISERRQILLRPDCLRGLVLVELILAVQHNDVDSNFARPHLQVVEQLVADATQDGFTQFVLEDGRASCDTALARYVAPAFRSGTQAAPAKASYLQCR